MWINPFEFPFYSRVERNKYSQTLATDFENEFTRMKLDFSEALETSYSYEKQVNVSFVESGLCEVKDMLETVMIDSKEKIQSSSKLEKRKFEKILIGNIVRVILA